MTHYTHKSLYSRLYFGVGLEAVTLEVSLERLYVGVVFRFEISIRAIVPTRTTLSALYHDHAIETIVTTRHYAHLALLLACATVTRHYHFFAFCRFTFIIYLFFKLNFFDV